MSTGQSKLQSLRGLVDLLPQQTPLWQHLEATAREHFRRAGVTEIRTPLLEHTELFARGIGEATDVVGKEMYTFVDRGDRSCTLRPSDLPPSDLSPVHADQDTTCRDVGVP